MKTVLFSALCSVLCVGAAMTVVSCSALAKESDKVESSFRTAESSVTSTATSACRAQQVLDSIYDNVEMTDGRIYLSFGARGTLTVDNFNKLILERQLGLTDGRFTFVMDNTQLSTLRHTSAYGGVGYGQDWVATLQVRIKDNETGEISEPTSLFLTLHKSHEADADLANSK